ncbi:endonuclease III-like protein 1 [Microplitis mediator]|uniref:endonuclease III-like protein 1 n=1 Tax=Microplitis mediator TaxID=375433 RepID=UPI00255514A9|nr:endonuclease III-like protein 1 [Microplitis mediator]
MTINIQRMEDSAEDIVSSICYNSQSADPVEVPKSAEESSLARIDDNYDCSSTQRDVTLAAEPVAESSSTTCLVNEKLNISPSYSPLVQLIRISPRNAENSSALAVRSKHRELEAASLNCNSQTQEDSDENRELCEYCSKLFDSTVIDTSDEDLGQLIRPVSFVKRKVQFIKQTTGILIEKYNGDIPRNIKELCSLPGVGPKVGHLAMLSAWNEVSGIGVDTHVHRVCNRLHWVKKPTTIPEETRKQLESWLPRDLWSEINFLFVGFGQNFCLGQNPKCDQCLLNKSCPSAIKSPTKNKKVKK